MIKEAEAHAEEDKRRRELVEARNQADATVYMAEKRAQGGGGSRSIRTQERPSSRRSLVCGRR